LAGEPCRASDRDMWPRVLVDESIRHIFSEYLVVDMDLLPDSLHAWLPAPREKHQVPVTSLPALAVPLLIIGASESFPWDALLKLTIAICAALLSLNLFQRAPVIAMTVGWLLWPEHWGTQCSSSACRPTSPRSSLCHWPSFCPRL
jgi:hypothetical protein